MKIIFPILLLALALTTNAQVYVRGYYRSNGTYVHPHYRSSPDGNPYNNWSYPGNINPYTGKIATGNPDTYLRNHYHKSSGSTPYVSVDGNYKSNGACVPAYYPSQPGGNSYTGKTATGYSEINFYHPDVNRREPLINLPGEYPNLIGDFSNYLKGSSTGMGEEKPKDPFEALKAAFIKTNSRITPTYKPYTLTK